ncbi:MAG TPA: ribokinase [Planctomycetaceae bacterium]|jgi:ribokinase|nr:ribokinase [Planctomycetaceae bacterium]
MTRPRIAVVGSINTDLVVRCAKLPRPGETISARDVSELPGGKGANQAVAAARLGAEVTMIGRVGDDAFGQRLRSGLQDNGVGVDWILTTPNCASGLAVVAVEDSGENAILVVPGANGRLTPDDVLAAGEVIRRADMVLLQLEVPLETTIAAVKFARECGTPVILDPAPAPAFGADGSSSLADLLQVEVACPNESEALALTNVRIDTVVDAERAACCLRSLGPKHGIVTLGARGAVLCEPDSSPLLIPAFNINAVDTTAAGDAFAAALAVRLSQGVAIADAVRFACAAGALAASRPGAQPAMPTIDEVESLLEAGKPKG